MKLQVDWEAYSKQYDAITIGGSNKAYEQLIQKVQTHLKQHILKGDTILDLGCGTGNFTISLAKLYRETTFLLLDNSPGMLEQARKKSKHLANIKIIETDMEKILSLTDTYGIINHSVLIHSLYATRSKEEPKKPELILQNLYTLTNKGGSTLISDIQRPLKTADWVFYSLKNKYVQLREQRHTVFRSMKETFKFFKKNDQAKNANYFIDQKQKEDYLLCSLDEFVTMVEKTGFKVTTKNDYLYRGRDNFIIAYK